MPDRIELQPHRPQAEVAIPYFSLQLHQNTIALIDMQYAQEVLVMPAERLTMMPNMPNYVLGLVNHRNRVFWVIDLAQMLGLNPLYTGVTEYDLTILRVGDFWLGLAGVRSQGIKRFSLDQIISPVGNVSVELERYLRGCIPQEHGMTLVLDAEAIANPYLT
jgi:positive phototaxis protein PixI